MPTDLIPVIFVHLFSGTVVPITYNSMDGAAGAMRHFTKVMRQARKNRKGSYVGTQTTLSAEGTDEVPTFIVTHSDISSCRFVMMRPDAPPAP